MQYCMLNDLLFAGSRSIIGEEGSAMSTKTLKKPAPTTARHAKAARKRAPIVAKGAAAVEEVRKKLGLTRKVFSRLTGFSERAIANWESGGKPDEPGLRRIKETQRFQEKLAEVVEPGEI